jgi:hypothetical protein
MEFDDKAEVDSKTAGQIDIANPDDLDPKT